MKLILFEAKFVLFVEVELMNPLAVRNQGRQHQRHQHSTLMLRHTVLEQLPSLVQQEQKQGHR
jgi:hypothetical protein